MNSPNSYLFTYSNATQVAIHFHAHNILEIQSIIQNDYSNNNITTPKCMNAFLLNQRLNMHLGPLSCKRQVFSITNKRKSADKQ